MSFFKFLYLSAIDFGIQWSLWGLASWLKTEKFYDLAGIKNKIIRGTYSLQCFNDVYISCRLVDVCFAGICGLPEVLQWSSSCQNSNSSYPHLGSSVSTSYSLIIYKFFYQVSLPQKTGWDSTCFPEYSSRDMTDDSKMPKKTHQSFSFTGLYKVFLCYNFFKNLTNLEFKI
jgi:hypothetical protein